MSAAGFLKETKAILRTKDPNQTNGERGFNVVRGLNDRVASELRANPGFKFVDGAVVSLSYRK